MKSFQRADTSFEQAIARMPPEVRATFAGNQIDALKLAFQQVEWKNAHSIDIRLSIPFPGRGFYLVCLAGRERRAVKRPRAKYSKQQAIAQLIFLVLLSGAVATVGYAVLQLTLLSAQRAEVYPTAIPWLQSRAACEKTGRIWENGYCWDAAHSPDF